MKLLQQLESETKSEPTGFRLINELTESKAVSTASQLSRYNARDIADFAFLYLITLQMFQSEFKMAPFAQNYALRTLRQGTKFERITSAPTDLYVWLHVLWGNSRGYLRDQKASELFWKNTYLNDRFVLMVLRSMSTGTNSTSTDRRYLMDLERSLRIDVSNYRSCRRLIADWATIDKKDQRLVVTRLLQAFRARLPNSELLPELERLAREKDLELKGVNNSEPEMDKEEILKQAVLFSKKSGMPLQAALFLAIKGELPK